MNSYVLGLMKEDAERKIAGSPTSKTVKALLSKAKSAPVRRVLTAAESAQLGAHIIGMGLAFHAIGEKQAIAEFGRLQKKQARGVRSR